MEPLPDLDLAATEDPLTRDADNVRLVERWLAERAPASDPGRVLFVLPAGPGSQPLLNGTLPKLVRDTRQLGVRMELVVGLNDDAAPPACLEQDDFAVDHLWTAPKTVVDDASVTFLDAERSRPGTLADLAAPGSPGRGDDRAIVHLVHQTSSEFSSGVNRVLLDVFALLARSAACGWVPPEKAVKIDAESYFLVHAAPLDLDSNGLALLLDALDVHPSDFLSTRGRNLPFRPEDEHGVSAPDWSVRPSAVHVYDNHINGLDGYGALKGPGFAASTRAFVAVGFVAFKVCTGAFADDYLTQVLAVGSGHAHRAVPECVVTNRVPPPTDSRAVTHQIARWTAFGRHVRERYGVPYIRPTRTQRRAAIRHCWRQEDTHPGLLLIATLQGVRAWFLSYRLGRDPAWGDTLRRS